MQHVLGGKVERASAREYGKTEVFVNTGSPLFDGGLNFAVQKIDPVVPQNHFFSVKNAKKHFVFLIFLEQVFAVFQNSQRLGISLQ